VSKTKPNAARIAATEPLTAHRPADPMAACNVCGQLAEKGLQLYVECDERDRPLPQPGSLLFIGIGHGACSKAVTAHPRLYVDSQGLPGSFPKLCGPCVLRDGLSCNHKKLKANGGPGLVVTREPGFMGMICSRGRGGCHDLNKDRAFVKCEGRCTLRLVASGAGA